MKEGKCWVAVVDNIVVKVINMSDSKNVDFEKFRDKSRAALAAIGEVKVGEIKVRNGEWVFIKRANHVNRGKTPPRQKEYEVKS